MERYSLTIGIILQVRMGSVRLPGKIVKKIGNKNLLDHIFYRFTFLSQPFKTVIATTTDPHDDVVEHFCKVRGIDCFRGSKKDVLQRYYLCAKKYGFDHIVRLTGDNPFTDMEELDNLIVLHFNSQADYTHSVSILPHGTGAEIFTFKALERSFLNGNEERHKEHVNEYIHEHPELFKIELLSVPTKKRMPNISLTVDTEADYRKACYIVENSGQDYITTEKAIALCLQYA